MPTSNVKDRTISIVRGVIHAWDPYSLIGGGAPQDEWDHEIAYVAARVPHIRSAADATQVLSSVFSSAFQPEGFSPEDCAKAGQHLYDRLLEAGVLASGT